MRALATTLVLLATSTAASPTSAPGGEIAPAAAPSPGTGPGTPSTPPPAPPAAEPQAPRKDAVVPTQALLDRVGQGDRMFLSGDHRGALFAYQDAVYLQPRYAPARVRLGRAYLALRYPEQAMAQAEAALAEEPESAEAKKLLDEARSTPPRPKLGPPATAAPAHAAAATPGASPGAAPAVVRVFKLSPDADAPPRPVTTSPAAPGGADPGAAGATVAPVAAVAPAAAGAVSAPDAAPADAPAPDAGAQKQVAAQHYRTALGFLQQRDWARAVAALSDAILADPALAVAYSARGSAQFGLGKYRDAAEDYGAAVRLDPTLGTPVYGLAECHRVLGDGKRAAELYERYARSTAADVREDLRSIAARRAQELR